jgi:hypothetical protein
MYQVVDNVLTITVDDWRKAGLTYDMLKNDSKRGYLSICRRGIKGNTCIDVRSIRKPERLEVIESALGRLPDRKAVEKAGGKTVFRFEPDTDALPELLKYRKHDGSPLDPEQIKKYVNRASIFNSIRKGLERHVAERARQGSRPSLGVFWEAATDWALEQAAQYPWMPLGNPRTLERAFKAFKKGDYSTLINGNMGNDHSRRVSQPAEKLLLALWRMNDRPFHTRVYELYLDFVSGSTELFEKSTGEVFRPDDFRHKGRAMEISLGTVRNILKGVVNGTAVYASRNGNFDYVNKKRPKQHRKHGRWSLSKVSMDDVALSRKSTRGWVYKYIAVDVVSGYWFRPAYVVGKPGHNTVIEAFRNMFCELSGMGLPMPGELEVEHHLMQDLDWLNRLFPFVRFCSSPTEKRAEHAIRSFKYGVSKEQGHTRGRWYAKHEAFRSVRNKVSGDFVDPVYQPQTIVADDLADIEKYNNELHPLQKTYPGMTRRQVLMQNANPALRPIEHWHLYRFIGNETETSIYNNDYCPVSGEKFELADFHSLKRLKPDNVNVTAFWMPEEDGRIEKVYLYQGDTYIGEALNRAKFDYNECAVERTDEDRAGMLHQDKRLSKFDKFIKDERAGIPELGKMDAATSAALASVDVNVIETEQPKGYEEDEFSEAELSGYLDDIDRYALQNI